MDWGKLAYSFILVLLNSAFLTRRIVQAKDLRSAVSCYGTSLQLECGKGGLIAIHQASFGPDTNRTVCRTLLEDDYIEDEDLETDNNATKCHQDVRVDMNRKCSGQKNCTYNYSLQTDKLCFSSEGVLHVKYDCMQEDTLYHYCNDRVRSNEGYISSPGYPFYYPRLKQCSWTLSASEGQSILVQILHLHLRDAVDVTSTVADPDTFFGPVVGEQVVRCDHDQLSLVEGIVRRVSVCGEDVDSLQSLQADANTGIEVRFKTADFLPAAGFLLHFKVLGCPSLPAPRGSVLEVRNGSWASYACRQGRVFNDTLLKTRQLQCVRDHHWNDTLPPCVGMEESTTSSLMSAVLGGNEANAKENATFVLRLDAGASLVADVIIPCTLIAGFILLNTCILIMICYVRKKQPKDEDDEFSGGFQEVQDPGTSTLETSKMIEVRCTPEIQVTLAKSPPLVEAEDLQDDSL